MKPVDVDVLVEMQLSIDDRMSYNGSSILGHVDQNIAFYHLILFWIRSKRVEKSDGHTYLSHHLCLVIALHWQWSYMYQILYVT